MSQALTSLQAELQKELENLADSVSKPTGYNVKTTNKVFTMPDGKTHQGPIQAVILDFRNENRFYTNVYNANSPQAPDCFAVSKKLSEMAPPTSIEKPVAKTCEDCPNNQFGSGANGSGKACKNTVKLAIVAPDAKADDSVYILNVPPTSLSNWSNYATSLQSQLGLLPVQVITEISFDPGQTYPKLVFSNPQPHDTLEIMAVLRQTAQGLLDLTPER